MIWNQIACIEHEKTEHGMCARCMELRRRKTNSPSPWGCRPWSSWPPQKCRSLQSPNIKAREASFRSTFQKTTKTERLQIGCESTQIRKTFLTPVSEKTAWEREREDFGIATKYYLYSHNHRNNKSNNKILTIHKITHNKSTNKILSIHIITQIIINLPTKYCPLSGGRFSPLPLTLQKKILSFTYTQIINLLTK